MQLLNSHPFLKRLSHGVQAVLHGHSGFFLCLFGCGQTGGTHWMQGVAFARIAFPVQDGGKEFRHIFRRRDGCGVHAERGLEQLQYRLHRLGRSRPHKQASFFRIPQAINDGRHKFRLGGQFGGDGLFQFFPALASNLLAGGNFLPNGFGKLEPDNGPGRLARVQPEGKAGIAANYGSQFKAVRIQRIAKRDPAEASAVSINVRRKGMSPQGVQGKIDGRVDLADGYGCS